MIRKMSQGPPRENLARLRCDGFSVGPDVHKSGPAHNPSTLTPLLGSMRAIVQQKFEVELAERKNSKAGRHTGSASICESLNVGLPR